jgi:hypothetical protein
VRPHTALWERKPEQGETSVLVRSASLLVAFHAVENDVAVLAGFALPRIPFLTGCSTPPPKADLLRQTGTLFRIAGRCHWMLTGEVPASTILLYGKSMADGDMPLKHLAAPPTFEANHVVPVNGSPDRHRGSPLDFCFGRRFTEADERPMNGRNQGR